MSLHAGSFSRMSTVANRSDASAGRPGATAGFTLIEVLVALALVAAVLGGIGTVIATTVRGTRTVEARLLLVQTAHRLLASLPGRDRLQPGTSTGVSGGFRWRMDVAALATQSHGPQEAVQWLPLAVTVRVQAGDGHALRLDTVRLARVRGSRSP